MTRNDIVLAARRWIGTPYLHQASTFQAGCDCLGLLRGVWREVLGSEPEVPPPYTSDWDEVDRQERLRRAAERLLIERPLSEISAGDVLLFRMRRDAVAKHLGICSDPCRALFVHAYSRHGVVETSLTKPWLQRLDGVFAFPGVE